MRTLRVVSELFDQNINLYSMLSLWNILKDAVKDANVAILNSIFNLPYSPSFIMIPCYYYSAMRTTFLLQAIEHPRLQLDPHLSIGSAEMYSKNVGSFPGSYYFRC